MASPAESQVTFRLPRRLAQRLDRMARRRGQKRSELLREAAEAYVDVLEGEGGTDRAERVAGLIGSVRSGYSDLGSKHAEYLRRVLNRGR